MDKKLFSVTLIRKGNIVSQKRIDPENKVDPLENLKKIAEKTYSSEFICFDTEKYGSTIIVQDDTTLCTHYYNRKTGEQVGEVLYDNGKIKRAWIEEKTGNYIINREETFLQSGRPEKRRLLIYVQKNYLELIHFSFEKYKDGYLDLFATSINDPAISSGDGDYVRYLYRNGKVLTKEIFKGNEFRYKHLSNFESAKRVPIPVLYCVQGDLAIRYTTEYSCIRKETDFKRSGMPCMIIESRLDTENFVDINSAHVDYIPLYEQGDILNDSTCKIATQYNNFQKTATETKSQPNNNDTIEYDINANEIEDFLNKLDAKEENFYRIKIHGTLYLSDYKDCISIFSNTLDNPKVFIVLDMSDCKIINPEYLYFENCPSLRNVTFPNGFSYLKQDSILNCPNLYNVTLPKSIEQVDAGAFDGCRLFRFFLNAPVSYTSLIYSSLKKQCRNAYSNNSIYPDRFTPTDKPQFNNFGFIELPKTFINGVVVTPYATDFQKDIGLSPYELKSLLTEQCWLVGNNLTTLNYATTAKSSGITPFTGADAIKELMNRKQIAERYSNLLINEVPIVPYNWRTKYVQNGIPKDTYLNQLYSNLLNKTRSSQTMYFSFYDKEIQKLLIEIAENSFYQSAMWYLKKAELLY